MAEGGMHEHAGVDRDAMTSSLDGEHVHQFKLPDGTIVTTEPGGRHSHVLHTGKSNFTTGGGTHAHKIRLPGMAEGEYIVTDADGWHEHEIGVDHIPEGGIHSHALWAHDGTILFSLTPGEMTEKGKKKGAGRKRLVGKEHIESAHDAATAAIETLKGLKTTAPEHEPDTVEKRDDEDWSWCDTGDLSVTELPATNPLRSE